MKPDPAGLCSNLEDAERFAAAAQQAFREAFSLSRVDEIMAQGFRIAGMTLDSMTMR